MIGKKVDIAGRLFHFDRNISSEDVIKEMNKDGCCPATLMELLALSATHPKLQRQFSIIVFSSIWRSSFGRRRVLCLDIDDNDRLLNIDCFNGNWSAYYCFLGFCK